MSSVEEEFIERAKKKMVLDHLVIQRMDTTGRTVLDKKGGASTTPFTKDDLTAILKFGADELFKDEEDGDEMPACDIGEILRRAEMAEEAPATAGDELLSAFKVASFAIEEEKELPEQEVEAEEDTKDWLRKFIRAFKKFPAPLKRLEDIACEAGLQEKPLSDLRKLGEHIERSREELMADHNPALKESVEPNTQNEDSNMSGKKHRKRGPSFKIGRVSLNAKTLLATIEELEPLDEIMPSDASSRRKWVLDFRVKPAHFDCDWEVEDDSYLLKGIYQYGFGSWDTIKTDPALKLSGKIMLDNEKKPQAKHLQTRALSY